MAWYALLVLPGLSWNLDGIEMFQAQSLEDFGLHESGLNINRLGIEVSPHYCSERARPCRLRDQTTDRIRDLLGLGGVGTGEHFPEVFHHGARNLGRVAILCDTGRIGRPLHVGEHGRGIGARLYQCLIDSQLRQLVTISLSARLDRIFGLTVEPEEWEGNTAHYRSDVDDQSAASPTENRQGGARCAVDPDHVDIELCRRLLGREAFRDPHREEVGVIDQPIQASRLCDHRLYGALYGIRVGHIEFDHMQAGAACLCCALKFSRDCLVSAFDITHRRVYGMALMCERFRCHTAEAAARARSDDDLVLHAYSPW